MHNNYGNYYTLLLIPVGLCLCLLIKLLSDQTYTNRSVVLNTGEYYKSGMDSLEKVLNERIRRRQELNDRTFIVKGLPLLLSEIAFPSYCALQEERPYMDSIRRYARMLCDYYGVGAVHGEMLWCGDADLMHDALSARLIYDEFIRSGGFRLKQTDTFLDLLGKSPIRVV